MHLVGRRHIRFATTLMLFALLAGCGGCEAAGDRRTDGGLPGACTTSPALPTPVLAAAYYIADCAAGAEASCVAGDDANAGTSPDAPRRTVSGIDFGTLPAGTQVLFARGGAWDDVRIIVRNANATTESPIVIAAYAPSWGGTARPILRGSSDGGTLEFGGYMESETHGGYLVRDIHLDGTGEGVWGVWVREGTNHLTVLDCEITGFGIGIHVQGTDALPTRYLTLRGNDVHHNVSMGMLAHADDMLMEDNRFASNNFGGSTFDHGVYLGGHGRRAVIRNNVLDRNSVVDGVCTGGNFTVHGQWEDVLLEGNLIVQDASDGGCYGFSITAGYDTGEWFRGFIVRGNTVVNLGNNAIVAHAAPYIVIEDNLVLSDRDMYSAAIAVGHPERASGDDGDHHALIRNNTIIRTRASNMSPGISVRDFAGEGVVVVSNLISYGAEVTSAVCFDHGDVDQYETFANNLCHGAPWSATFATLALAQAAGFDEGGTSDAPAFETLPSAENAFTASLSASSPAVDRGHPTLSSTHGKNCAMRDVPDIGAFER